MTASKEDRIAEYQDRIEAKRERYAELAGKHAEASKAAYTGVRRIMDAIPLGQPILVDHYSAKRHRKDISRMDRGMKATIEHQDTAAYYAGKAESYGKHGISSSDPAALDKLKAKLVELEKGNEEAKQINAYFRKHNALPEGLSEDTLKACKSGIAFRERYRPGKWSILGTNAPEIKRIRDRIAGLEKTAAQGTIEVESDLYTYEEDAEENRINFYFASIPSDEIRSILKGQGFKWSPSRKAWTRIITANARTSARWAIKELDELQKGTE